MGTPLTNDEILATLRELNENVTQPLWLFGDVTVDFLVGRWTRPHGDIDLNTLSTFRGELTLEIAGGLIHDFVPQERSRWASRIALPMSQ